MIPFEDAKKAVESIYGPIKGYKLLSYSRNDSTWYISIGSNYVFVGEVFVNTPAGGITDLKYSIDNIFYGNIYHSLSLQNSYGYASFIGQDNVLLSGSLVTYSGDYGISANVLGWVFQIDK
jgi:hypothetical protein